MVYRDQILLRLVNISLLLLGSWIIISMMASNPSMELASCKVVLGIYVMASCVFLIMEHICDINELIQWMRIKLACLLVTSSHWLDKVLIVRDNFHLQWHHDQDIWSFLLRSHICQTKLSHNIFERLCIQIQYIPGWILSYRKK